MKIAARLVVAIGCLTAAFDCAAANSPKTVQPNVLLITLDTVRADRIGAYGARGVATPVAMGWLRRCFV